jgi:hypothetical protein
MLLWWTGVVCVRKVENLLINSSFIVRLQENTEFTFLVVWCCMGYASKGERVVGKLEETIGTLLLWKCGSWLLRV